MANEGIYTNGDYTIQTSGSVNVQSNGDCLMLNALATEEVGGYLALNADSTVTLTCGSGAILFTKDSDEQTSLLVKASDEGSITFVAGTEETSSSLAMTPSEVGIVQGTPVIGPRISLADSEKIELAVGPPGVGSSIELTLEGITIKFAEWSISLNAMGITLSVGPTSVTLAPESLSLNGLMVNVEGVTQAVISAVEAQISGDAMVQISGGITMLG